MGITGRCLGAVARSWWLGGLCVVVLSAAACNVAPATDATHADASVAPARATRRAITDTVTDSTDTVDAPPATPVAAPLADDVPAAGSETKVTLTLWTVTDVSTEASQGAKTFFQNGLDAFERANPNTKVSVVLKNDAGKGSVLDYLETANLVAPSVLPDLVVLNTFDLTEASQTGILVPLEDLIAENVVEDLTPTAAAASTVDGHLVGVPFEIEVLHVVFNQNKITEAPANWTGVLSGATTYLFPVKGHNGLVNDSFLAQYLALGGGFQDEAGKAFVDEQRLVTVLNFYREGFKSGVFPEAALQASSVEEAWPTYVAAEVGMADVTSHLYLSDRGKLRTSVYAPLPSRDGANVTIARGKVLAITTRDPLQQAAALRLIAWMLEPENAVAWSETAHQLPTRYAALERLSQIDPYFDFARQQLEAAVPAPSFSGFDQVGRVLQQSVTEVLSGEAMPEEAAAAAFDAIPR